MSNRVSVSLKNVFKGSAVNLPVIVDAYKLATTPEKKKQALWKLREAVEKKKNVEECIRTGVTNIVVQVLVNKEDEESRLWALWVLRFMAESETGASDVLQEAGAVEALVEAVHEHEVGVVGSKCSKRALDTIKSLAQHMCTSILLVREDVFQAVAYAFQADPSDACTALAVYYALAEVDSGETPSHLSSMVTAEAKQGLKGMLANSRVPTLEREKAQKLLEHFRQVAQEDEDDQDE